MAEIYKTWGIVFRCIKYSETSVIVDIYTAAKGMRSFIISGLNSKKNKSKAACFQHLNIVDIVAYEKPNGGLARIKEHGLRYFYKNLPLDVVKSSVGLYVLEVSRNAIKESEGNPELYRFIETFLIRLDEHSTHLGLLPIKFMLDLAKHLGIVPMENYSASKCYLDLYEGKFVSLETKYTISKRESNWIYILMKTEVSDLGIIIMTKEERTIVLDELIKYYTLHLDHFKKLNSVSVLREIF